MDFKVMFGNNEIGRSQLEYFDDGMGIASGDFHPAPAYTLVKPLFCRLSEACNAGDVPTALWTERDSLSLQVIAPDGTTAKVDWVMIHDFDSEGAAMLEVKLLDTAGWNKPISGNAG